MPDAVPNYLTVDSAGVVSANFPGGVTVLEDPNPAGDVNSMANGHGVTWYDGPNGAIVAQVAARDAGSIPTGVDFRIQGRSPDQSGFAGMMLSATNGGDAAINTLLPFNSETLLDSAGNSHWLQLGSVGTANRRINSGTFVSPVLAVGNNVVIVPVGWLNNHFQFLGIAQPNSVAFTLTQQYSGKTGGNGFLHINTSVAQAVTIDWMSIGN